MGCSGSKVDDLPLVTLCRERKELIRAAVDHRYALASAHISYFRSLKDVGGALGRFVDEELVIGVVSPPPSPVLTLPSDLGKKKKKKKNNKNNNHNHNKSSSSSTSLSHSAEADLSHPHSQENDSHLHFSSEDSDTDLGSSSGGGHLHISPEEEPEPPSFSSPPRTDWSPPPGYNSYSYYMKRSSTAIPSVVYGDEPRISPSSVQWHDSSYSSGYPQYQYGTGGYFGVSPSPDHRDPYLYNRQRQSSPPTAIPSPPPPPVVSAWDFLNPFDSIENSYPTYYSQGRYGIGSSTSSPNSMEVREREGIPDLEDETGTEQDPPIVKEARKGKQLEENMKGDPGEGTSRAGPLQNDDEGLQPSMKENEINSSPETVISKIVEEEDHTRKKEVSFEVDDDESSKPSSLTTLSTPGTRDLQEVVQEIKDEFETASDYGKELSVMLEVGKLRYQSRGTILKVISSRILGLIAPHMLTSSHHPSSLSQRPAASIVKMANTSHGDLQKDVSMKSGSLSSTLEKLYVWEKKLYKEVKDEERLRIIYERKCKKLRLLDNSGAESNKIDSTRSSIRKLLTKINVAIRTVEAISSRIHKLRDEELRPQVTELIHGLIRMWKFMLKCHQKQFQAILESKGRTLIANTVIRRDSRLRATVELEMELLNWCTRFNDWINTQKAYVESLNGWLLRCMLEEPEETPDGIVPFSPGRMGAPQVFIICNDWFQAMERISGDRVANTMNAFAISLHQLWERQDEEWRQRLKAEYLSKDFEKRIRSLRKEQGRVQRDQDALSDKTAISVVPSESGVSPLDDLKVDLDSMRMRLEEERTRHKEAVKHVHKAASDSLKAGLIPIFKALGNFTTDTLKAYEQVRIGNGGGT